MDTTTPASETPRVDPESLIPTLCAEARLQRVKTNELLASVLYQSADAIRVLCDNLTASNTALAEANADIVKMDAVNTELVRNAGVHHDEIVRLHGELAEARERAKRLEAQMFAMQGAYSLTVRDNNRADTWDLVYVEYHEVRAAFTELTGFAGEAADTFMQKFHADILEDHDCHYQMATGSFTLDRLLPFTEFVQKFAK